MVVTRDYLVGLNLMCYGYPAAFDYRAEKVRVETLANALKALFSDVSLTIGIQDANHHADIGFGSGAVRLSLFERLAVILNEEACSSAVVTDVSEHVEACSFTFVPWHFFGELFGTRERINGDLFNQFDYQ